MSGEISVKLPVGGIYNRPTPEERVENAASVLAAEAQDAPLTQRHEQILGAINFYVNTAAKRQQRLIQRREKLPGFIRLLSPRPKLPAVTLEEIGYFLALTYPKERWNERGVIHTSKVGFQSELETLRQQGLVTIKGRLDKLSTKVRLTAKGETVLNAALAKSARERSNRPSGEDPDMLKFSCCV